MNGLVTLTSDFGLVDPWVAEVRAALETVWARYPGFTGRTADLGHSLPRGDVAAAAWFLRRAACGWPAGTVHLAVVDPGVGSGRPAVACRWRGSVLVGPGNGLFSFVDAEAQVVILPAPEDEEGDRRTLSNTFHGRDIFAPAAAHLAAGRPLEMAGRPGTLADLGVLPAAEGEPDGARLVWIDHFGNAISDLERESETGRALASGGAVLAAGHVVSGPVACYAAAEPGEPFWYWGSGGTLEIGIRDGSAAAVLDLRPGLVIRPAEP